MTVKILTDQDRQQAAVSSLLADTQLAVPGQQIEITGIAPAKAIPGEWVTIKSHAFSSRFTSDGFPSLRAEILVDGTYQATATLLRGLTPASYTVLGCHMGQSLDTSVRISVGRS
jgi:hypothetical protein